MLFRSRNKHGKNFSDAVTKPVINPDTKLVQRKDGPGARLSFSRSKDPEMKPPRDEFKKQESEPLLGRVSN